MLCKCKLNLVLMFFNNNRCMPANKALEAMKMSFYLAYLIRPLKFENSDRNYREKAILTTERNNPGCFSSLLLAKRCST